MEIKQVQSFVKRINEEKINTPVLIIGATGIGKSCQLKDLTKEMGIGFMDLRLATQEVTDLIGNPRTVYTLKKDSTRVLTSEVYVSLLSKGEINEEDYELRTYWTKPVWWPSEGTRGILALEEVNRAPEDVRQAIFELLTEWKLHTHVLPEGWSIVSLINPDNNQYHVNQLDPAFRRRFIQIVMTPADEIDWGIWAKRNGVNDDVLKFVAQFPKLLSTHEDINIEAIPTPAGHHMLSKLLNSNVIPDKCLMEVASGIIGKEAAIAFIQSRSRGFEKPISAKEILTDYPKVHKRHLKLIEEKRNDLLYVTMVDMISTCEAQEGKIDKTYLNNLHEYLKNSPAETLTTIILRMNEKMLNKLCKFDDLIDKVNDIKKQISDV